MYDTVEMTASVITYLQYEYIHITSVSVFNPRIDVMARPKSSLCMYTSTNMPINVLKVHVIIAIMYTP